MTPKPMIEADAGARLRSLPDVVSMARHTAVAALFVMVASIQFSIAIGQIAFAIACAAYFVILAAERRFPAIPAWASPLILYAAWTLASASASADPVESLRDCKQLTLLLIVPVAYEVLTGRHALSLTTVIVTTGAISAMVGISQYSLLDYNYLGLRPSSTLSIYMTFAGLMMLVANVAVARLLFWNRDRAWSAITLLPVGAALALSLTRSAWIGAAIGIGFQLTRRDYRWLAALPIAIVLGLAVAPIELANRAYSIFDARDETRQDRLAMVQAGIAIIGDHPVFGVGPDRIREVYPLYRPDTAVHPDNPHLHNVPLQIAAERGLPALAIFVWFVVALVRALSATFRLGDQRLLAGAALGACASMITAGMFEYNFGDSEFLMLFLVLITLPFAAGRDGGRPA